MKYPSFTGDEPCRSMPVELYYPDNGAPHKTVINMCMSCEIVDACRTWGLHHESFGLWGGLTEQDRRSLRARLNIVLEPLPTVLLAGERDAA